VSDTPLEEFLAEAREKATTVTEEFKEKYPPVWKPEAPGEEIYGKVIDIYPNPWEPEEKAYVIETPSGSRYMLPRNRQLVNLLEEIKPQIGDLLYVRFDHYGKEKKGRSRPKIFAVYVKRAGAPIQAKKPVEKKVEEAPPPVKTAAEIEEKPKIDPEFLRAVVEEAKERYGNLITIYRFEKHLRENGVELKAEEAAKILPDKIKLMRHGVKIL